MGHDFFLSTEACPFCRRVREAMTELDLSVEVRKVLYKLFLGTVASSKYTKGVFCFYIEIFLLQVGANLSLHGKKPD